MIYSWKLIVINCEERCVDSEKGSKDPTSLARTRINYTGLLIGSCNNIVVYPFGSMEFIEFDEN